MKLPGKKVFFAELGPASKHSNNNEDHDNDSEGDDDGGEEPEESAQTKVKTYSDTIQSLDEVMTFF